MSQSRSRKPQSFGGENSSRARSSVVKQSSDAAHSVHHQNQPKTKQNSRTKNKIPKSIRYDLDNALVSRRPRRPANSAAFSPTPQTASKVRFVRQPTSRPPSPIQSRLGATTQNKNLKIKSPKRPRKEVKPQSPPHSVVVRPRLCRSCQPSDLSPRTKKRRVHTASSLHTRDNLLSHPCKVLHKKSQTNITWVTYQSSYYANVDPASYTVFPKNTNVSNSKNRKPWVQQQQRTIKKSPNLEIPNPEKLLTTESSHKKKLTSRKHSNETSTNHRPTSPEILKELTMELPFQSIAITQARDRHRSREKRLNTNSVKSKKQTGEGKVDPSIVPQSHDTEDKSNSQFSRCFATTNFNQPKSKKECMKNRKVSDTDCNVIFDQDLIDIIGTKNDKRLRILFHSPMREESSSVLNLLPSPNQRIQEARSKRKHVQ